MKGLIFDIKRYALHDGPGIRQTIFFKGCALRCWWCHNPESQLMSPETTTREYSLDGMSFCEKENVGQLMTVDEVMDNIKREIVFFDESGGGVTFSGGEPLLQPQFLKELALECRQNNIHCALDTCGYAQPEIVDSIAGLVDLFLYDLKLIDDRQHRQYTGASNSVILENLRRLALNGREIIIRFPIIPGITDPKENVQKIIEYVRSLPSIRQIDLLPYHAIAGHKYQKLQVENKMIDTRPPSDERIQELKNIFEHNGFTVKIGG